MGCDGMGWARSRVSRWMDGMVMNGMGRIAEVIELKCRKEREEGRRGFLRSESDG